MKKQEEREELQAALATIEKLAPKIYSVLKKGFYRIFVSVRNETNQTSVSNIPFKVEQL